MSECVAIKPKIKTQAWDLDEGHVGDTEVSDALRARVIRSFPSHSLLPSMRKRTRSTSFPFPPARPSFLFHSLLAAHILQVLYLDPLTLKL
jgi:hypothetical protein